MNKSDIQALHSSGCLKGKARPLSMAAILMEQSGLFSGHSASYRRKTTATGFITIDGHVKDEVQSFVSRTNDTIMYSCSYKHRHPEKQQKERLFLMN